MCEPTVERSTKRLTRLPSITPPAPVATSSEACSDGRLAITVSTRSAMSFGEDAGLRAERDQSVDRFLARIEHHELMPGLDQAARHGKAHLAEADKSDVPWGGQFLSILAEHLAGDAKAVDAAGMPA